MKHVGEAIVEPTSQNQVVTIGIAPFGCIQDRDKLVYVSIRSPRASTQCNYCIIIIELIYFGENGIPLKLMPIGTDGVALFINPYEQTLKFTAIEASVFLNSD